LSSPATQQFWDQLRLTTQSRIGLGRSGNALPTARVLEFNIAHAAARDAVHIPLDVPAFAAKVAEVGIGDPIVVASQANGRGEYLRRPDLGGSSADLEQLPAGAADIGVVLADGLSPRALARHGIGVLTALVTTLGERYSIAAPVIATQARVALGDHIGARMGVRTLIVVIGERPGLSVADSLGIYLTHLPRAGCTDADRNCISNIHPPEGLAYVAAARVVAALVEGAWRLGRSGISLKDTSRRDELTARPMPTLD
jgi:ethanolamine ammonia-lyase small subunit